jgi:hypothetical protein
MALSEVGNCIIFAFSQFEVRTKPVRFLVPAHYILHDKDLQDSYLGKQHKNTK